jgi:hypothetical protein
LTRGTRKRKPDYGYAISLLDAAHCEKNKNFSSFRVFAF